MKIFPFLFLFVSAPAFAYVQAQFLVNIGMLTVRGESGGQQLDDDPDSLYAAMNVPPDSENIGTGKGIKLPNKALSLVCALHTSYGSICTAVVKEGPEGKVSAGDGLIRFASSGAEAAELFEKFVPTADRSFSFVSADKLLRIEADPDSFLLEYKK